MNTTPWFFALVAAGVVCAAASARGATATNAIGAGQVGYWADNASWNVSPYPGSGANESAYLNNSVASSYTNILNAALGFAIKNLTLANTGGEAWLLVTNTDLTCTTLTVGTGGRLRIDYGGTVSNPAALSMSTAFGQIHVVNSGRLFSGGTTVGSAAPHNGVTVAGGGALWNLCSSNLALGRIFAGGSSNRVVIDGGGESRGAIVTNVGALSVGDSSIGNALAITNGGRLFSSGVVSVGYGAASGNSVNIMGGNATSVWNVGGQSVVIADDYSGTTTGNVVRIDGGGVAGGAVLTNMAGITVGRTWRAIPVSFRNSLIVTNGGYLFCGSVAVGGGAGNQTPGAYSNHYAIGGGAAVCVVSNGTVTVGEVSRNNPPRPSCNGGNLMTVANANLRSSTLTVGWISSNNTANVFSNALWNLQSSAIFVGSGVAGGNAMTINGGTVTNAGAVTVGNGAGANANSLTVTNGGQLFSAGAVVLADTAGLVSNRATVAGSGSLWSLGNGNVTVGLATTTSNMLTVDQGGVVTNVGTLTVASNNAVNVYGGGSLTVATLTVNAGARIGVDVVNPGSLAANSANVSGTVSPVNLPRSGKKTITVLTAGSLTANLVLGPLPAGYSGTLTTQLSASPKRVDLNIKGPGAGTVVVLR